MHLFTWSLILNVVPQFFLPSYHWKSFIWKIHGKPQQKSWERINSFYFSDRKSSTIEEYNANKTVTFSNIKSIIPISIICTQDNWRTSSSVLKFRQKIILSRRSRISQCRRKTANHSVQSIFTAKRFCHMKEYFLHPQSVKNMKKTRRQYLKNLTNFNSWSYITYLQNIISKFVMQTSLISKIF